MKSPSERLASLIFLADLRNGENVDSTGMYCDHSKIKPLRRFYDGSQGSFNAKILI